MRVVWLLGGVVELCDVGVLEGIGARDALVGIEVQALQAVAHGRKNTNLESR
jgi:hypothetical protein